MSPIPSIGDIVHYVSYGTPDGEYGKACRAAVVTEVSPESKGEGGEIVGLAVLNPTGFFFDRGCEHNEGTGTPGSPDCPGTAHGDPFRYCACGWVEASLVGGTWHWPAT